jgi:glucuronate isomerase
MPFIHKDFLLQNKSASRLYHQFAEESPILDYHTHLSAEEIAENRQFSNLYEIWLRGDHYKWRAMRANGVSERFCTGDASDFEKFLAWAATVPYTLRNPLYHWTHLELKRYFDIDDLLDEQTAPAIWKKANQQLANDGSLTTQGILKRFNVQVVCTTDDPTDSLEFHERIASSEFTTKVYPTFRPDKALRVDDPSALNPWVERLGDAGNVEISTFATFLTALRKRHDEFHRIGCRLSDHGLQYCPTHFCSEEIAGAIFDAARSGRAANAHQHQQFAAFMMVYFGHLDAEKGWTKQLHLGALRNASAKSFASIGPDAGFDSIGDWPQAASLAVYLSRLQMEGALPKMILYNVNPTENYALASLAGSFQDGPVPGKIQFGSGWWFLDQKEGMEWQLNALSNVGLLSRFVGMLTDSRSFMSYPRHEYFRRVLCNLIGQDLERGLVPDSEELVGEMLENICFHNARRFLGLEMPHSQSAANPAGSAISQSS